MKCLIMLTEKFSSAFEYYLSQLVEREKCINTVESEKIIFKKENIQNKISLFSEIISG